MKIIIASILCIFLFSMSGCKHLYLSDAITGYRDPIYQRSNKKGQETKSTEETQKSNEVVEREEETPEVVEREECRYTKTN